MIPAIPLRYIILGIAAVLGIMVIFLGYRYVENIQNSLIQARSELAEARLANQVLDATNKELHRRADEAVKQITVLETARASDRAEWEKLQQDILKTEDQDKTDDKTVDRSSPLNAVSDRIDRMLERASRPKDRGQRKPD